jgi:hypothetical protein
LAKTLSTCYAYTQEPQQAWPASFLDMAPQVLKVHEQDTAIMEKRKGKRKVSDLNEDGEDEDDVLANNKSPTKKKRNKQRVLLLSSRGITHRMRHLMNDLEALLPHVKKGVCVRCHAMPCPLSLGIMLTWPTGGFRFEARFEEPPQLVARTRRFTLM